MDKILKTTENAFCNYSKMISRFGITKQQDRIRLLILYFFYYLKYKSGYLIDITEIPENVKLEINKERELKLNKAFKKAFECLSKNSCFIHDNNCCFDDLVTFTPPSQKDPSSEYPRALVTNANGSYSYRDLFLSMNTRRTRLEYYITTNDSNDYIKENDSDGE
jgi:hypothetical protein